MTSQRTEDFLSRQLHVQRQNFTSVCRLTVKSLTDCATFGIIEEGRKEVENFLSILEHILNHRMKPSNTWYGSQEMRSFWEFVRVACRRVPHSCLSSIESLRLPQTSFGKGRAWIRMCLMEKRLSEYISIAIQQTKLLGSFYDEGSIMLSDDIGMLADLLLGLNVLDFSFDIKGTNLDFPVLPVIDYTPYLKYEIGQDGSYPEIKSNMKEISGDELGVEFWKSNYQKLQEQLKRTNEQKNYLDEMLRLREIQLDDVQRQKQRLTEKMEYLESERSCDRTQLEAIVVELQSQITHLKNENDDCVKKLQMLSRHHRKKEPSFSMSELIELEKRSVSVGSEINSANNSTPVVCSASMPSSDPVPTHSVPASKVTANNESTSILVSQGSGNPNERPDNPNERPDDPNERRDKPVQEDGLSTIVLAGSFAGQEDIGTLPEDDVFSRDSIMAEDDDDDDKASI